MKTRKPGFALLLLAGLTGCPGFGDATLEELAGPRDQPPTWDMEIGPLLVTQCGGCHTNPPQGGAPQGFRLDAYADDENGDGLPGARSMQSRIQARAVNMDPSPMPFTPLDAADRALLQAWIDAGAPKAPETM